MGVNIKNIKENSIMALVEDESIEVYNVMEFRECFEKEITEKTKYILIDLKNVTYIDSSGIGLIIQIMKSLFKNNGRVVLFNIAKEIKRVLLNFDIFENSKLAISFAENEEEALTLTGN